MGGLALHGRTQATLTRVACMLPLSQPQAIDKAAKIPDLEEFLSRRDYLGAIALLQFRRHANRNDVKNLEGLAYSHFHYGEHDTVRGMLA